MTEEQIERQAERRLDALDRRFTASSSNMTQDQYDRAMKEIDAWAMAQLKALRAPDMPLYGRRTKA